MTDNAILQLEQDRTNVLKHFRHNHKSWIDGIKKDDEDVLSDKYSLNAEQEVGDNFINYFLASLSPNPQKLLSKDKDFEIIKKTLSSILEAVEEDILTEPEANALLDFVAMKFVESRFEVIFQKVFDVNMAKTYSFRSVARST
ncbi:MAG: hypothetical protein K8S55_06365 [Phycisphaerae bacterium]|nr:hypothetical protein [Phycisphaerae bacterium]